MVDPPPLAPDDLRIAEALFRLLLAARQSGGRVALVNLDDGWGVRICGPRVDVTDLVNRDTLLAVPAT